MNSGDIKKKPISFRPSFFVGGALTIGCPPPPPPPSEIFLRPSLTGIWLLAVEGGRLVAVLGNSETLGHPARQVDEWCANDDRCRRIKLHLTAATGARDPPITVNTTKNRKEHARRRRTGKNMLDVLLEAPFLSKYLADFVSKMQDILDFRKLIYDDMTSVFECLLSLYHSAEPYRNYLNLIPFSTSLSWSRQSQLPNGGVTGLWFMRILNQSDQNHVTLKQMISIPHVSFCSSV